VKDQFKDEIKKWLDKNARAEAGKTKND